MAASRISNAICYQTFAGCHLGDRSWNQSLPITPVGREENRDRLLCLSTSTSFVTTCLFRAPFRFELSFRIRLSTDWRRTTAIKQTDQKRSRCLRYFGEALGKHNQHLVGVGVGEGANRTVPGVVSVADGKLRDDALRKTRLRRCSFRFASETTSTTMTAATMNHSFGAIVKYKRAF